MPNNQFELDIRVVEVLARFDWMLSDQSSRQVMTVRPVAGVTATWADSRFSSGDGGQEGSGPGTTDSAQGSIGITVGVDFVFLPTSNIVLGISTRALWTGARVINADRPRILQANAFIGYQF